jgi:hypothetical protein
MNIAVSTGEIASVGVVAALVLTICTLGIWQGTKRKKEQAARDDGCAGSDGGGYNGDGHCGDSDSGDCGGGDGGGGGD